VAGAFAACGVASRTASPFAIESGGLSLESRADLDLGAQIGGDGDGLENGVIVLADHRHLQAALAEDQRAGRNQQRVRIGRH
jgi:hypothetical protein